VDQKLISNTTIYSSMASRSRLRAASTASDLDPANRTAHRRSRAGRQGRRRQGVSAARAALKAGARTCAQSRTGPHTVSEPQPLEQHQEELVEIESLDAVKPLAAVRRQDMAAVIDTVRLTTDDGLVRPRSQ